MVIADLDAARAQAAARQLSPDGSPARGVACDVSDQSAVERCVRATRDAFGGLDIVVNNAGLMTFHALGETSTADWRKVRAVDLIGAGTFTRQCFLHMGEAGGAIVNFASIHAVERSANAAPYAAARAALVSLTHTTAIEGRERRIRANAVMPGAIDTPMLWKNPNVKSGAEAIDPSDVGKPEDIAAAAAFLASEDVRFVTGTTMTVDGGRFARL